MQSSYQLVCVARDDHSPHQLSSSVTIAVHVDDENDNAPAFTRPAGIRSNSNASDDDSVTSAGGGSSVTVLMSHTARPGTLVTAVCVYEQPCFLAASTLHTWFSTRHLQPRYTRFLRS